MPFSFLNPWFWLGALAVAAPVWLHLRRKRQSNLLRFSAVRFLEDQPEPRRSPLHLRNLALFALRVAALLLVVAAFAWPYVRRADNTPVKESRVYILDNTLSHQANNGFAHDRDRVVSELSGLSPGVQTAVIELTSLPRVVASFSDERQTARRRLQELQPSFQRGSYLAAFRQANSLLANSLGRHKRIVFLGDNQQNQWAENAMAPPFMRDVQIDTPKLPVSPLPNLWLSEPRVQRIFLGDKSLVNLTVKLNHTGDGKAAAVTLRANGQVVLNKSIDLVQQPHTILVQAQWEAEPGTWLLGDATVEGRPDSLPADNRVFFTLPPLVEGTVALLAQSPYLRVALSPEIMRGQWATRVLDPTALPSEVAQTTNADVLCIESAYLQSADARTLVSRYLTNGHGVLLLMNRVTPATKAYLRDLGFSASNSKEPGKAEKFQFVALNHPIFHPFLSPDYGNLMDIRMNKYAQIRGDQAMPLIFSENGAPIFFQGTKFPGKLFVAAFGLDREHTTWPIHQSFIPFLDLTLQAARAEDPTPTTFEPGEATTVQVPAASGAGEVILRDEQREVGRATIERGRAQLRLPEKPGIYALNYDTGGNIQKLFCINPSPKESELVFSDSFATLKSWQLVGSSGKTRALAGVSPTRVSLRGILQQHVWWWMIVAGIAALVFEGALAETRKGES